MKKVANKVSEVKHSKVEKKYGATKKSRKGVKKAYHKAVRAAVKAELAGEVL